MTRRFALPALALLATMSLAVSACTADEVGEPSSASIVTGVPISTDEPLASDTPSVGTSQTSSPPRPGTSSSSSHSSNNTGGGGSNPPPSGSTPSTTFTQSPPDFGVQAACEQYLSVEFAFGFELVALMFILTDPQSPPDQIAQTGARLADDLDGQVAPLLREAAMLTTLMSLRSAMNTTANETEAAADAIRAAGSDATAIQQALEHRGTSAAAATVGTHCAPYVPDWS